MTNKPLYYYSDNYILGKIIKAIKNGQTGCDYPILHVDVNADYLDVLIPTAWIEDIHWIEEYAKNRRHHAKAGRDTHIGHYVRIFKKVNA